MLPRLQPRRILRSRHRGGDRPARARSRATWCTPICAGGRARKQVEYPSPELEAILERTLGVPLFQEQAMQIAIEAGGFTPGEADQLRRAMATFKRTGTIGNYKQKMIEGMVAQGLSAAISPSAASSRSRVSANTAFRKAMPPPSRCWSMPPAGSRPFIPTSSARRSSTRSRWGFMRRRSWCATRATMASRSATVDVNHSDWDCTLEKAAFDPGRDRGAPCRDARRHPDAACRPARLPPDQGPVEKRMELVRRAARRRL